MNLRVRIAHFLIKLGELLQSLPVVVMKPDNLVDFSRQTYTMWNNVEEFTRELYVDQGLSNDELALLDALPVPPGDLLLLGVGGGREAIPLAKDGFCVTGVDFVRAMVDRAEQNALRHGVKIKGLVQDISRLEVAEASFDVIWLSRSMYSFVPTRPRRVELVKRIAFALKPGGVFICQFHWDPTIKLSNKARFFYRLVAICTLGNLAFEPGDVLWGNGEFLHIFGSEDAICSELKDGGLSVKQLTTGSIPFRGSAICIKCLK